MSLMTKTMASTPTFVGAIIKNTKGEILLQKRDSKVPTFKNCWTLFGGQVKVGEKPKTAILRELEEEISLTANSIKKCKIVQINHQENEANQYVFLINTHATINNLILKEGEQTKFIKRKDILNRKFAFN